MNKQRPTALVILDGFGCSNKYQYNAIAHAHMKHFMSWLEQYPHVLLEASGEAVGLERGVPGNSLAGHFTLGTGRVTKQVITLFDEAIQRREVEINPTLVRCLETLKKSDKRLHIMGLLSDGSSHSHERHLYALIRAASQRGIQNMVIHPFLDGRDVAPRSAAKYLEHLEEVLQACGCGVIGTIHGRSYAMDRGEQRAYIQKSFDVLTQPYAPMFASWQDVLAYYYQRDITDEFIPPTTLLKDAYIHDGDGVIFYNVRSDRARPLATMLAQSTQPKLAWLLTAIRYASDIAAHVLYELPVLHNTLLDVLEASQKKTFIIAEHEKYAHVTYFFNGGRDIVHPHEMRMIIPSLPPQKYILHPEMSAPEITDAVLRSLTKHARDFYLINYANPDMVGHTGNFEATVKAVQCIDAQLEKLHAQIVEKMDGTLYIVGDHGKAEEMFDDTTGQQKTGHTTNAVYFLVLQKQGKNMTLNLSLKGLADVAPFILQNMMLPIPEEMLKK